MGAEEALYLCGWVAWLERDAHAEHVGATSEECIDGTPRGTFEQRGVLPTDAATFDERRSGDGGGGDGGSS